MIKILFQNFCVQRKCKLFRRIHDNSFHALFRRDKNRHIGFQNFGPDSENQHKPSLFRTDDSELRNARCRNGYPRLFGEFPCPCLLPAFPEIHKSPWKSKSPLPGFYASANKEYPPVLDRLNQNRNRNWIDIGNVTAVFAGSGK